MIMKDQVKREERLAGLVKVKKIIKNLRRKKC